MLQKKEENISLTFELKRTGVAKNIIYLERIEKINRPQPTLDAYLQANINNGSGFVDDIENQIYEDD